MEQVIDVLEKLNIKYELVRHPAIYGREDEDKVKDVDFRGQVCKNLFLKDRKQNKFYLVSLPVYKKANLKYISDVLHTARFSFGNENELWEKLHIKPGSVSILNIIGAPDTDVTFVIDKKILELDRVSFHPNDNTASVSFEPTDIPKILKNYNKDCVFIEVEEP